MRLSHPNVLLLLSALLLLSGAQSDGRASALPASSSASSSSSLGAPSNPTASAVPLFHPRHPPPGFASRRSDGSSLGRRAPAPATTTTTATAGAARGVWGRAASLLDGLLEGVPTRSELVRARWWSRRASGVGATTTKTTTTTANPAGLGGRRAGARSTVWRKPRLTARGGVALRRRGSTAQCVVQASSSSSTTAGPSSSKPTSTSAASSSSSSVGATKTSSSTSSQPTSTSKSSAGGVSSGYWTEWSVSSLPPESIQWSNFDFVSYAFAVPQSDGSVTLSDPSGASLKRFVAAAHARGKRAVLSIGGWGQSGGFSGAASGESTRSKMVSSLKSLRSTYSLDGFDFDWEYPNNVQGGSSSAFDTMNFQTLLQQVRSSLGDSALLTAAVPHMPWLASNGQPVGNVSRAAGALDYIVIMNYDVWGSSSSPGPNAPLANLCGNSTQPAASAAAGVRQWSSVGMPRSKMLLGVPAYGYVSASSRTSLVQRRDVDAGDGDGGVQETTALASWVRRGIGERGAALLAPRGGRRGGLARRGAATVTSSTGSTSSGQVNFGSLVQQKALVKGSDGRFNAGSGWTKHWDDCSDTPYLTSGGSVVTYDDTDSLYDKGAFASQAGIAGVSMWSLDGDTSSGDLQAALRSGMAAGATGS